MFPDRISFPVVLCPHCEAAEEDEKHSAHRAHGEDHRRSVGVVIPAQVTRFSSQVGGEVLRIAGLFCFGSEDCNSIYGVDGMYGFRYALLLRWSQGHRGPLKDCSPTRLRSPPSVDTLGGLLQKARSVLHCSMFVKYL